MSGASRPRRVLVTGATRGVGAAIVDLCCIAGDDVLGVYRSEEGRARARERQAGGQAGSVEMVRADLGHDEGIEAVVAAVADRLGRLEGLVLNAGIAVRAGFSESWVEGRDPVREQLRIDLEAPLLLTRALLGAELLAHPASIVFVSSNLARHGLAGKVAYGAAKAGVEGATRGLARELGPAQIRVNAVAPGLLRTDMTAEIGEPAFSDYALEVPLGRPGEAIDVARVVEFLLGPGAGYVTGHVLDVDGGWGC